MEPWVYDLIDWLNPRLILVGLGASVLRRVGYSGWWSLFLLIPYLDILAACIFVAHTWPIEEQIEKVKRSALANAMLARRWEARAQSTEPRVKGT
jgi:hypothetical protein